MPAGSPTIVLVHGAGHTSMVWQAVQDHLRRPSLAVDLPGRRDRPDDITSVTIAAAAESAARDVDAVADGQVVLVGHSAGGIVLPALAALLGDRVDHLVFVAGLSAPDGRRVLDYVVPAGADAVIARLEVLRDEYADHVFQPIGPVAAAMPAIDDTRIAANIDSLNYITQVMSWAGVSREIERTFVRSLHDPIQPRELQAQLAENCAASSVVDVDARHTAALDAPADLAAVLGAVAGRHDDGS